MAEVGSIRFGGRCLQAPETLLIDRIASRDPRASDVDNKVVAVQAGQEIDELGHWQDVAAT